MEKLTLRRRFVSSMIKNSSVSGIICAVVMFAAVARTLPPLDAAV
jgi:hypothetical protein